MRNPLWTLPIEVTINEGGEDAVLVFRRPTDSVRAQVLALWYDGAEQNTRRLRDEKVNIDKGGAQKDEYALYIAFIITQCKDVETAIKILPHIRPLLVAVKAPISAERPIGETWSPEIVDDTDLLTAHMDEIVKALFFRSSPGAGDSTGGSIGSGSGSNSETGGAEEVQGL